MWKRENKKKQNKKKQNKRKKEKKKQKREKKEKETWVKRLIKRLQVAALTTLFPLRSVYRISGSAGKSTIL